MNARQKRLFEDAKKRNPDLKIPESTPSTNWSEDDLALVKQGVGDKTSRPAQASGEAGGGGDDQPSEQTGTIATYFEEKGFGFLRPDDGSRDIFFHVSRLQDGFPSDLKPGLRIAYELGMDRSGKIAASRVRIVPETPPAQ